jgi:hypothetical protein
MRASYILLVRICGETAGSPFKKELKRLFSYKMIEILFEGNLILIMSYPKNASLYIMNF